MEARERFAAIASLPDADIRLAEAALWLAAEGSPGLDVADCLGQLQDLADEIRPSFQLADRVQDQVAVLNRELFVANHSLISALADALLDMDAASDFASIPAAR